MKERPTVMGRIYILQYEILDRVGSGRRFRVGGAIVLWRFLPIGTVSGPCCHIYPQDYVNQWV
jgi:hypothetical protein